jgi:hydrogenase maturation protease
MNDRTLILGLGNDILKDDGIGPQIVKDLTSILEPGRYHFNIASSGGLEILEYLAGFRKVIIIDAIKTGSGKPGDVYCFTPDDFMDTLHLSSLHDVDFITALRLGESLSVNLPEEMNIIAVEIVEDMEFGEDLTPAVREKYGEIRDKVIQLVVKLSAGQG